MSIAARIALAVVIVVFDFVSFLIPIGSIVIACVLIWRPRWAKEFVDRLYEGTSDAVDGEPQEPPSEPPATSDSTENELSPPREVGPP